MLKPGKLFIEYGELYELYLEGKRVYAHGFLAKEYHDYNDIYQTAHRFTDFLRELGYAVEVAQVRGEYRGPYVHQGYDYGNIWHNCFSSPPDDQSEMENRWEGAVRECRKLRLKKLQEEIPDLEKALAGTSLAVPVHVDFSVNDG